MKLTSSTRVAAPMGSRIQRLRKWCRGWWRGLVALRNPLRFAQWVNDQRCSLAIENDPSGVWHVRIGCLVEESTSRSLGEAMCHQVWMLELHPDWIWTSDYLESVNTELTDRGGLVK